MPCVVLHHPNSTTTSAASAQSPFKPLSIPAAYSESTTQLGPTKKAPLQNHAFSHPSPLRLCRKALAERFFRTWAKAITCTDCLSLSISAFDRH